MVRFHHRSLFYHDPIIRFFLLTFFRFDFFKLLIVYVAYLNRFQNCFIKTIKSKNRKSKIQVKMTGKRKIVCFEEITICIQEENLSDYFTTYVKYSFGFNLLDDEILHHDNNQVAEYSKITFKYTNIVD